MGRRRLELNHDVISSSPDGALYRVKDAAELFVSDLEAQAAKAGAGLVRIGGDVITVRVYDPYAAGTGEDDNGEQMLVIPRSAFENAATHEERVMGLRRAIKALGIHGNQSVLLQIGSRPATFGSPDRSGSVSPG